ncbi:MAG TPA: hypothetical protein VIH42_10265 [Thermoguttaceae bacterium]
MSTITSAQSFDTTVTETFTAQEMPATSNRQIQYNQFNETVNLNAGSTPPATKVYAELLEGDQTLDFTSLARSFGADINATGLKLQQIQIYNTSDTATLVVAKGASNGYPFNGAAGNKTILPGARWSEFFNDGLADIDGTHKNIDITITEGEEYQIVLVFG